MNLGLLLDMAASAFPDRVAVTDDQGALTYAELLAAARGAAAIVAEQRAESVAFVGTNDAAFPVALLGAALAGVPIAPLNYRLATTELTRQLRSLPAPIVVAGQRVPVGGDDAPPLFDTRTWVKESLSRSGGRLDEVDPDTVAVFLFTSGTTAEPKRAVVRHKHLASYVMNTVEFGAADPADASLVALPAYHIAGVGTVLSNLYAGRRLRYLTGFDPELWLETVRGEAISHAMVVPTMLTRLVEHLGDRRAQTPTLRSLAYGGAKIPAPVLERALRAFPEVGFVNAYGLTETSSTIAVLGPEDHRAALTATDPRVRRRLSSAGRLVPGVEAEIRDTAGTRLAPNEVGGLWVRGPQVSGEYSGAGSVVDPDGWFETGDRASIDEDGYLFVEGRQDDTIIRGGENIAPAEIEDVLLRHPQVREAAVVGVADQEWGERTVAVVVRAEGSDLTADAVRSWAREHLRGSRTPDQVVFAAELPYTPTGKLLRRQLKTTLTDSATKGS